MRSCGRPISPTAHITFCTFDEVFRPQILIILSPAIDRASWPGLSRPSTPSLSVDPAGFLGQHDRDAVADRIGQLGGARDQLLLLRVVFERALGQRADQDFKQLRIDTVGGTVGGRRGHWRSGSRLVLIAMVFRPTSCSWQARSR